ncbi:hypothetical protein PBCV1_a288L [Paramecium bursaria Chlorella virus 1]|uniref:Uncharacterized protein n=1 Tax=Paramecium bursaria Chlorella virus 1 TaxID=10506 RepID=Q84604_PBCV1|nr:hypothetical protein PBCV1_a288L [Paramecium bursaria Chlorella virus 1]AAC96656.1 hypothetical protein [Paramecium bursaria Chlorella virus 1]
MLDSLIFFFVSSLKLPCLPPPFFKLYPFGERVSSSSMRRPSIYARSHGSHHSKYSTSNASTPCFCMAFRSLLHLLPFLQCAFSLCCIS